MVAEKTLEAVRHLDRILREHNYPDNKEFQKHLLNKMKESTGDDKIGMLVSVLKNF